MTKALFSTSGRPKQRRSCRLLLPPVAGCAAAEASPPPTTPTAGQAIPLLTHTPCYSATTSASHRSRTSEPSYSSSRGHPLLHLPLAPRRPLPSKASPSSIALVLLARRGQHGQGTTSIGHGLYVERLTAGSTAAARKCLLIAHKKINTPLPAGTHHSERLTCGPTKLTGMEGFVNLVNMNDSSSCYHTMFIQRP